MTREDRGRGGVEREGEDRGIVEGLRVRSDWRGQGKSRGVESEGVTREDRGRVEGLRVKE